MERRQVISELQAKGIDARGHQVSYAVENGKIERPPMSRSMCYEFGPEHVEQLVSYFNSPRRKGPKPQAAMPNTTARTP